MRADIARNLQSTSAAIPPSSAPDEYVDTPGASLITSLAVSTLNKRRLTGEPPRFLKLGRRVVYSRRTLEAWLQSCERASTSDAGAKVAAA